MASIRLFGGTSIPARREAASLKVLVVDDCPLQRLLSTVLLSRWGITPELACDGVDAVLLAGERQFDLILMDIQMDILDGVTATKRIRQNERRRGTSTVPIIAYTCEPLAWSERLWANAGISASLAKPCRQSEMGECLRHWCGVNSEPVQH
jgi:CheY-like chemotaxis protein